MTKIHFLLALSLSACGSGSSQPPPSCRTSGEACAATSDCCAAFACNSGHCTTPTTGCPPDAPIDCGAAIPNGCCDNAHPYCCKADQLCHTSAADCGGNAGCNGKACASNASCCAGYTCSRFGLTCQRAVGLDIGESCTADGQCSSGLCSDYCTKFCGSDADCPNVTYCIDTSIGFACVPYCGSNADCAVYGVGVFCQTGTDPTGLNLPCCLR